MIGRDAFGYGLEQHRLTGARRSNDQAALAFADRGQQIHDPGRQVFLIRFQPDSLIRIERSQVIKQDLVSCLSRMLEIDCLNLDESEITLAVFGWANLSGNRIPCSQIEFSNL